MSSPLLRGFQRYQLNQNNPLCRAKCLCLAGKLCPHKKRLKNDARITSMSMEGFKDQSGNPVILASTRFNTPETEGTPSFQFQNQIAILDKLTNTFKVHQSLNLSISLFAIFWDYAWTNVDLRYGDERPGHLSILKNALAFPNLIALQNEEFACGLPSSFQKDDCYLNARVTNQSVDLAFEWTIKNPKKPPINDGSTIAQINQSLPYALITLISLKVLYLEKELPKETRRLTKAINEKLIVPGYNKGNIRFGDELDFQLPIPQS